MENAVRTGDFQRVQELIRSGDDVNPRLSVGTGSLLIVSISHSYNDIALALLEAGADVHAKDVYGRTALHLACERELEEVVQPLIDSGSRVDEPDAFGVTPLERASSNSAMCLLRAGASYKKLSTAQIDSLFHHACRMSDLLNVGTLLEYGCNFSTVSYEQQEELLHSACRGGDLLVVRTLLTENDYHIASLSHVEKEELLRCAFQAGDTSTALTTIKSNCGECVGTLSREEQENLLQYAFHEDDIAAALIIAKSGCSIDTLSSVELEKLLHCACHEHELLVARTLVSSSSVSSLTREQLEELLHYAFNEDDKSVTLKLIRTAFSPNKLPLADLMRLVNQLPNEGKKELLWWVCVEGNMLVVEALIADGCNVNCVDLTGDSPLMMAVREGHEELVKKLIFAGAKLKLRDEFGGTALHVAAVCNHIQCGILLVEGGASVMIKNQFSETPLDVAKADFKEAIKQTLSFTTRKTLCIIGNAEGGKSTLIESLKTESTGFLERIFNRFRRVSDCRQRTAGIETIPHCSQRYGEVLFFDFAGQDDYHGPHQMFLESLLSKPGVSMTILLVIKVTDNEEAILHQLHRWLSPVVLMSISCSSPQVIVIGSFLDKVRSKHEATVKLMQCIQTTRKDLEEFPLRIVGTCLLNCRQPQSEGIDQLCTFLQEIPVPEFRATHTRYSLAWILSKIRSSLTVQAVQLLEFSMWVQANKDNLPQTMPTPEEVCQDLSAAGHALYLPNKEDPNRSWLVLDLPSILHKVYGNLFSKSKIEIVNEFGLLHCRHLDTLFPDQDLAMVQQLLISLEFCISVDPSVLKVDLSKLTQSKESSGWLFFPALISAKFPKLTSEDCPEQSVCWQLRTSKKHSISARLLQTILLRLAAHFVVKQHDEEGVQQHCCSIWWNGISWQSTVGVDITVHIMNNRVIQVIAKSGTTDKLCPSLTDVVSDILSTVLRLSSKLAAAAYIVHPPKVATTPDNISTPSPKELYPVEGIRDSIGEHKEFALSLMDSERCSKRTSVADLFAGHIPSLKSIEKIIWTQPVTNQPLSPTELQQSELCTEGNGTLTDFQSVPLGARALLNISSTPDMRDLDELVVGDIAAHWQKLALRLGVKDCLSEIIFKNHPNDCEGACRDLLARWLKRERHTGKDDRTWSTLLVALGRAGFEELERRLRREHVSKQ